MTTLRESLQKLDKGSLIDFAIETNRQLEQARIELIRFKEIANIKIQNKKKV